MKRRDFIEISGGGLLALLGTGALNLSAQPEQKNSSSKRSPSSNFQAARSELMKSQEAERLLIGTSNTRQNARLLQTLVQSVHARRVLEIGTYQGYSTLWMAMALEEQGGGKLTTIERDPLCVLSARKNMQACGLERIVTCLEGDAHSLVKTLKGHFDFIFLDADKDRNEDYLKSLWPLLNPGGFLCANGAKRFAYQMKNYFSELDKTTDASTHYIATMSSAETDTAFEDAMALTWKRSSRMS